MCSLLKFVPLVFLLVSELQAQGWVYDDRGCRTPDRGVGNCIRIKQCASMVNFLINLKRPISQRVRNQLNDYLCNYKDNSIYVCCPEDPITIVGVNQTPNPTPTPLQPIDEQMPPDVTGHKNLNLLSEECGWAESDNKIRNGKNARLKEFPWMVLLSYKTVNGPKFMCGGTIINEKYVLTAAHCIVNTSFPLMMQVRVGEYNIPTKTDCEVNDRGIRKCLDPVQDVAIEEIIPHPQFTLDVIQNDIGLLRIAGINMSANNVQPICLPVNENTGNPKLNSATITGWGITDPNGVTKSTSIYNNTRTNRTDWCNIFGVSSIRPLYPDLEKPDLPKTDSFFQQDGGSPHYAATIRNYLDVVFPNRWIGRRELIDWPASSPDLTPFETPSRGDT